MVIQCESCQTEFNLDESLLKKEGTKVRCSRCRHVFTAYPASTGLPEEADEIPDISEGAASVFPEKSDLGAPEPDEDSELDAEKSADEELDSDLDVIYRDVFSEDDRDAPKKEGKDEDGMDDLFEKAASGEQRLAESPASVFPDMDTSDEDFVPPVKKKIPEDAPDAKKKSSKRSMMILVPLLFIVLGVAAAYYVWKADLVPRSVLSLLNPSSAKKAPADAGARLLQFGSVSGAFVDTQNKGPLFVIRGMVTNKYPQNRRFVKIKGSILDNKGVVVLSKTAYAGNTFSEEELKTLPLDEIMKAAENRDGMAKQNLNVASGATIPFMVVFADLPDDLSEFTVEAVGSSPGS